MVRSGGVCFDVDAARTAELVERLDRTLADVTGAVQLLWDEPSVQARFEETGTLSRDACVKLGLVGPVARACGVQQDVRRPHALILRGILRHTILPRVRLYEPNGKGFTARFFLFV